MNTDAPDPISDPLQYVDRDGLVAAFGVPEYRYFKSYLSAHGRGRNIRHYNSEWVECDEAEFLANHEQAHRTDMDRFMGRRQVGSFYRYEKRLYREGWPQVMEKALKAMHKLACQAAHTP